MMEIDIDGARFVWDGKSLTIRSDDDPNLSISLNNSGVSELIKFIRLISENEFNQRLDFRVPLWHSCGLSVQIRKNNEQRMVTPKDISMTGIFVELRSDDWLELAENDDLEIILDLDGRKEHCDAVVGRCRNYGYGIFFTKSMRGEHVDPPSGIADIVMELQRKFMVRRLL
jgi:hypothetical protein